MKYSIITRNHKGTPKYFVRLFISGMQFDQRESFSTSKEAQTCANQLIGQLSCLDHN